MIVSVSLAGVNGDNALHDLIPASSSVTEALVIFGALFLVTLVAFAWAVVFRPGRRRRGHSHHHRPKPALQAASGDAPGGKFFSRARRKHHRQPDNLPRNPTLAEAGGLPPVRPEDPSPPPT